MLGAALVAFLVMAAILLIVGGLAMLKKADPIQTRLMTYAMRPRTLEEIEVQQPLYDRTIKRLVMKLAGLIARWTPRSTIEQLRQDLMLSGSLNNLQVNDFLRIKGLAALGFASLAFLSMIAAAGPLLYIILGPLIGAFLGFYVPDFWLRSKIGARQKAIQLALPDCLDLLSIGVEAGLGFDAAIQKVVDKWDNALTREFDRAIAEVRMGKPRREALRDISTRCGVRDVTSFIAAIIQVDQLGISISRVLTLQSEQMRMKRRQRAERLAHEGTIRMLVPVSLFTLPAVSIAILGPIVPKLVAVLGGG